MNDQVKELALRTGKVIYEAIGNDPQTLATIVVAIAAEIADGIKADSSYTNGLIFLGGVTDNMNKLGQASARLLTQDELSELKEYVK